MKDDRRNLPIGFMDSGLGGISVLKSALKIMPDEDFIYYGDSLHAPYGTKEPGVIKELTFNVVEKLLKIGIKGMVVACNTATSAAVRSLREMYPDLPLVGIEPAIKPAVEAYKGGNIIVMATPMTIKQEKFNNLLEKYADRAKIIPVPCKGLMEFVEAGNLEGKVLDEYFDEVIAPYVTEETETVVLGCTHYSFLRPHLREYFGDRKIALIDGNDGTSREIKSRLKKDDLLKNEDKKGTITFLNSIEGDTMIELSRKLLNYPID